jgi:pimeloyl-ACP methyl ester carboxylesterase
MACAEWRRDEELGRIEAPTLILHGDAEREEVVEQADRLESLLPHARKVVVPGAGQMILYEQPASVAEEIGAFLEELR